ncbi:hypothetical protein EV361DRAFT_943430 [Lentinula raphanica]|nr:hypothetical protein EV361DRAFT_943430 [Lentinula raphanica]
MKTGFRLTLPTEVGHFFLLLLIVHAISVFPAPHCSTDGREVSMSLVQQGLRVLSKTFATHQHVGKDVTDEEHQVCGKFITP